MQLKCSGVAVQLQKTWAVAGPSRSVPFEGLARTRPKMLRQCRIEARRCTRRSSLLHAPSRRRHAALTKADTPRVPHMHNFGPESC